MLKVSPCPLSSLFFPDVILFAPPLNQYILRVHDIMVLLPFLSLLKAFMSNFQNHFFLVIHPLAHLFLVMVGISPYYAMAWRYFAMASSGLHYFFFCIPCNAEHASPFKRFLVFYDEHNTWEGISF